MKSKLTGIFQVKLFAKNILPRSPRTHHQVASAVECMFLKKRKKRRNFLNQTVTP